MTDIYTLTNKNKKHVQIGTTKGTGGDVLILEEAAYCDEGFFYEVKRNLTKYSTLYK
jgi:hypothetical protein